MKQICLLILAAAAIVLTVSACAPKYGDCESGFFDGNPNSAPHSTDADKD